MMQVADELKLIESYEDYPVSSEIIAFATSYEYLIMYEL